MGDLHVEAGMLMYESEIINCENRYRCIDKHIATEFCNQITIYFFQKPRQTLNMQLSMQDRS